jgi:hypothetical protein
MTRGKVLILDREDGDGNLRQRTATLYAWLRVLERET